ncbi:MAG: hypothetical protein LBB45_01955 [Methanobrevibacter sp.]|nr:hypothetical protein [Candidatus Methanovirga basalitermitum]
MNPVRKANILIVIIIAILGLGVGNIAVSFTGDYVKEYINLNTVDFNENSKMLAVEDGQFNPTSITKIDKEPIIINNWTNNNTKENNSNENNSNQSGNSTEK